MANLAAGTQAGGLCSDSNSATLEILHRPFVFLPSRARLKRAEIPTLACLRILLPPTQAIATGLKFSDHEYMRPLFLHTLQRIPADLMERSRCRATVPGCHPNNAAGGNAALQFSLLRAA